MIIFLAFAASAFLGCKPSASQLKSTLKDNPDILAEAIEANPVVIMKAMQKASRSAQEKMAENERDEAKKAREEELKNPKKPELSESRPHVGPWDAPITIVEYSDFECPYCSKGYETVKKVIAKYGDKVRFIYKHLPLPFHQKAMPAAIHFEAVAKQDPKKAIKFHDKIFENQDKLRSGGEKWMQSVAKSLGVDMARLKKDIKSESIKTEIKKDMAEAKKYEFSGTPGFLVNGVSLKGAYPAEEFYKIIDPILKK